MLHLKAVMDVSSAFAKREIVARFGLRSPRSIREM